jgi:hypothetical protein
MSVFIICWYAIPGSSVIFRIFVEPIQQVNGVDGHGQEDLRAGIAISGDLWQVGRGDLSARQLMPIDFAEPFMGKHVPGAVPQIPVPFRGVAFQKLKYEIGCEGMEGGPTDERGPARDLLVEDDWVHIRLVVWWETR